MEKRVIDHRTYLISQMTNVNTYTNSPLTAEDLMNFEVDHIVLATGWAAVLPTL
jgi:dimethylamine/trimethylamine dehydrogenase